MELKDQLEDIQRRVEDEIQAGVPPVRHALTMMIYILPLDILSICIFMCMCKNMHLVYCFLIVYFVDRFCILVFIFICPYYFLISLLFCICV